MSLPFDPRKLIRSSTEMRKGGTLILGGLGVGKTFCGATASQYFPDVLPSPETVKSADFEPIELKDMLHVACDVGAVDGFAAKGLRCPAIDLVDLLTPPRDGEEKIHAQDILQAISWIVETCKVAATEGTDYIIVDTVSMLDRFIVNYWKDDENIPKTWNRKLQAEIPDTQAMWGCVADTHFRLWQSLVFLPVKQVIFLCHARTNETELSVVEGRGKAGARQTAKAAASNAAGENTIIPRISGSAREVYTANVSLQLAMTAEQKLGTTQYTRRLHPYYAEGGYQTKNRYQGTLEETEAANLKKLFDKIAA